MAFEPWDYVSQVENNGSVNILDLGSVAVYLEENVIVNLYLASAKDKLCFSTFAKIPQ